MTFHYKSFATCLWSSIYDVCADSWWWELVSTDQISVHRHVLLACHKGTLCLPETSEYLILSRSHISIAPERTEFDRICRDHHAVSSRCLKYLSGKFTDKDIQVWSFIFADVIDSSSMCSDCIRCTASFNILFVVDRCGIDDSESQ